MADQRSAETIIRLTIDKAAAAEAQRVINNVKGLLNETSKQSLTLDDAAKKVNRSLAEIARNTALDELARDTAKAAAGSNDAARALKNMSTQLSALGASDQEIDRATAAMLRYTKQVEAAAQAELQRQAAELADDFAGDFATGGKRGVSKLSRFGRELKALPAVAIPGLGISTDAVGKITQLFGAMGAAAGPAALAIGAVAAAIALITTELNRNVEATRQRIDALKENTQREIENANAIRNRTRAENEEAIKDAQDRIKFLQEEAADLNRLRDEAQARADSFGDIAIRARDPISAFNFVKAKQEADQYSAAIEENSKAFIEASEDFQNAQNVVAPGIAAKEAQEEAEKAATKAAEDHAAAIRKNAQLQVEIAALIRNGSSAAVEEQIRSIEDQIAANRAAADANRAAGLSVEEYRQPLADLIERHKQLTEVALPGIEAREAETEAIKEQIAAIQQSAAEQIKFRDILRNATTDQINDRLTAIRSESSAIRQSLPELAALAETSEEGAKAYADAQDRLAALNNEAGLLSKARPDVALRDLNEALTDLTADIEKLARQRDKTIANANQKLADGIEKLNRDLADAQKKNNTKALRELAKFNQEEKLRVKEHRQALKDIQRDADLAIEDAAANLDAAGVFRAQQQRDRAIQEENDKFKLESEKRRQDLADLRQSIRDQEQEIADSYQRRYNELVQTNQREVQAAQDKYLEEATLRRNASLQQINELQQFVTTEARIRAQANAMILSGTRSMLSQIASALSQARNAASNAQSLASSIGKSFGSILSGIPKFASGGNAPNTFIAGERGPELIRLRTGGAHVTNARDTQRMLGGNNITVNVSGVQDPQRAADIAVQKIQRLVFNS